MSAIKSESVSVNEPPSHSLRTIRSFSNREKLVRHLARVDYITGGDAITSSSSSSSSSYTPSLVEIEFPFGTPTENTTIHLEDAHIKALDESIAGVHVVLACTHGSMCYMGKMVCERCYKKSLSYRDSKRFRTTTTASRISACLHGSTHTIGGVAGSMFCGVYLFSDDQALAPKKAPAKEVLAVFYPMVRAALALDSIWNRHAGRQISTQAYETETTAEMDAMNAEIHVCARLPTFPQVQAVVLHLLLVTVAVTCSRAALKRAIRGWVILCMLAIKRAAASGVNATAVDVRDIQRAIDSMWDATEKAKLRFRMPFGTDDRDIDCACDWLMRRMSGWKDPTKGYRTAIDHAHYAYHMEFGNIITERISYDAAFTVMFGVSYKRTKARATMKRKEPDESDDTAIK
jgi:hypothetical protein